MDCYSTSLDKIIIRGEEICKTKILGPRLLCSNFYLLCVFANSMPGNFTILNEKMALSEFLRLTHTPITP